MKAIVNIGELITSGQNDVTFRCLGLGSCVGVFLQDRMAGISGAAHIFLPGTTGNDTTFRYAGAARALQEMLYRFKRQGSDLTTLRAKITGGANLFADSSSTGRENADAVVNFLAQHKVYIAATDIGGIHSRIAEFECRTGTLHVKFPQTDVSRIY